MRKVLTLLILFIVMLSLNAETITVRIYAYVPERITFEQTTDTFTVNSNMNNVEYGFYNYSGFAVNPEDADVLSIRALWDILIN